MGLGSGRCTRDYFLPPTTPSSPIPTIGPSFPTTEPPIVSKPARNPSVYSLSCGLLSLFPSHNETFLSDSVVIGRESLVRRDRERKRARKGWREQVGGVVVLVERGWVGGVQEIISFLPPHHHPQFPPSVHLFPPYPSTSRP